MKDAHSYVGETCILPSLSERIEIARTTIFKGNTNIKIYYLMASVWVKGMVIFVTKSNGSKQLFDKEKIVRTCLRFGADRSIAEEVAKKIEVKIYDGMETRKILQLIFRLLRRYKPVLNHLIHLRRALSLIAPRDFERFIQIIFREHGYEVTPNRVIKGRCVEHEVDAIVTKNNTTYLVEVKHHTHYHALTGLDESRIMRAVLEDVTEGSELGTNDLKIDKAMIICNTKFSDHAQAYGQCRGIHQIGWSCPPYHGLQELIEEKKLHPITCLKDLGKAHREKLMGAGVLLLRQLLETKASELETITGMTKEPLTTIIEQAKRLEREYCGTAH